MILLGFFSINEKDYQPYDVKVMYSEQHTFCLYQDLQNPEKMEIVKESSLDLNPCLDLT